MIQSSSQMMRHALARPRVLCVDDEPQVLSALSMVLARQFEVVPATSPTEALRKLQDAERFTVILSDFRMPDMDGAEFLGRAWDIAPHSVRILLTGHASVDGAIAAVNRGHIFRFLTKPCPPSTLIETLRAAAEHARSFEHVGELQPTTNLAKALTGAIAQLDSTGLLEEIDVRVDAPDYPVLVAADNAIMEQLFLHLLRNAADTVLNIRSRASHISVRIGTDAHNTRAHCLIEDNGRGIPQNRLALIFDSYYETKPGDAGIGRRLFIVKQIIEAHHGSLVVMANRSNGTALKFSLPLARAAAKDSQR